MKKFLLSFVLSLTIYTASAKLYSISASLSGANESPANSATGTGKLTGTIDNVSNVLNYTITFTGLTGPISGSHFHNAAIGVNGPVIVPFSATTSPFTGSATILPTQTAAIFNGNVYVNLHTSAFPGGEIRGQLAIGMEVFDSNTMSVFYGIGGFSYTEGTFPSGFQASPYLRAGPLPYNDFVFEATSPAGFNNFADKLRSATPNQPITITFKSNNVRKMRAIIYEVNVADGVTGGSVLATATTNLGNTSTNLITFANPSLGFRVLNENEYITKVEYAAPPTANSYTAIDNILFGDDTPQNVALNLDGDNDFVQLPSTVGNFDFNQDFTVALWVKPDPIQTDLTNFDNDILEKWDNNLATPYPFVIRYFNQNAGADAGKIRYARYDAAGHNPGITSSVAINDGRWHHITVGRENGSLFLAIDGINSGGIVADNTTSTTTNNAPIYVGQRASGINSFKGLVDEIRIHINEEDPLMFCKNPSYVGLQAAYNFSNGVPNGNNALITQVQDILGVNHGTLNNFAKTGNVSNFVTGQVKYVKKDALGNNNGSSWTNAFTVLQDALIDNGCNDLFDVYVATGKYMPHASNKNSSFNILEGMKIYGGFAGTEKNINERNLALIHTTNKTTLSGDLDNNDVPFVFNFNINNNAFNVVKIIGDNVIFDGFTVGGGQSNGLNKDYYSNFTMNNCRVIDNINGLFLKSGHSILSNSIIAGNNYDGIFINNNSQNIINCLIANNGFRGIFQYSGGASCLSNLTNCTIVSNGSFSILNNYAGGSYEITNNIKNTIIKDNGGGINDGTGITNNITNSLVQGVTTGTGNLDDNTSNPQFISPLANNIISDAGNYRLKDSSPCINTGTDSGISPLDLDRNLRPKGGKTDMGAYESNVNLNEIISIINGNWETNSTWNLDRIPLETDKVIMNGHTVTVTTATAKAKIIEQKPSSDLKFNIGGSLMLHQ
jgi:hypothetical protein